MADDLIRARVQLPWGGDSQYARYGPGWTDLWIRPASSDEDVLDEVWVQDAYRVRGLDKSNWGERTIIDIGACTGLFSALVLAYRAREVLSVEPDGQNVLLLERNAGQRGARVLSVALAAEDDRLMRVDGGGATGHAVDTDRGSVGQVRSISLHSLITFAEHPVALLKCDIEGGEYDAVLACPSETLNRVERFAFEWHGPSECPWVERERIGELVQHLQHTHSCSVIGRPSAGGYLWAHRNDL